jgi:putative addiction module component (TIGR02574 family)
METVEILAEQVMQLPVGQRLTIAQRILASMEEAGDAGAHAQWEQEIRARIARYDNDPDYALAGPAVFAELDEKLGR